MRLEWNDIHHLAIKTDSPESDVWICFTDFCDPLIITTVASAKTISSRVEGDPGNQREMNRCEIQYLCIRAWLGNAERSWWEISE